MSEKIPDYTNWEMLDADGDKIIVLPGNRWGAAVRIEMVENLGGDRCSVLLTLAQVNSLVARLQDIVKP